MTLITQNAMPFSDPPVSNTLSQQALADWLAHVPGELASQCAQPGGLNCSIVGLNGQQIKGWLTRFDMPARKIKVRLSQEGKELALGFEQFRALYFAAPKRLEVDVAHPPPAQPFTLVWNSGEALEGLSIAHRPYAEGIFMATWSRRKALVRRVFLSGASVKSFAIEPSQAEIAAPAGPAAQDDPGPVDERRTTLISTPEALIQQIDAQSRMPIVRIGEALSSLGLISTQQLEEALALQRQDRGIPLGEILLRKGVVSRADLQLALALKMGYPMVNLQLFPSAPEALRKLPFDAAARLGVLPLMFHQGRLVLAMEDPISGHGSIDEVEFIAQCKVAPVIGRCPDLEAAQRTNYEKIGGVTDGRSLSDPSVPLDFELTKTSELLQNLEKEDHSSSQDEAQIEQSDNSLVRLINRMILEAHRENVSDIHIESYPGREKIKIRFRRDGRLFTYLELPPNYRNAIIARIKIMCDLDISEKRKPQDGKINFAKFSPQHKLELRVATIPTTHGLEDVVMRLLASSKPIPLADLGLSASNLHRLKEAVERPYGLVLCVGPTGSGKTTTLHSTLMQINTPERKIWTAEDPIEITQAGLRQVQVNPRIDWTFAKALRAFVRADPDVIMVGEIRDEETAKTAVEASLTGHLVLSTLHTNSAPETVTRLLDMGMDPFNFADSLLAVMAQRLVRRLCARCVESRPATEDQIEELLADYLHSFTMDEPPEDATGTRARWLREFGQQGRLMHHQPRGCPACAETGFRGRVGIHELMVMSRNLRRLVQSGARAEELQQAALGEEMRTLRQDGIDKVLAGHTTIDEVRATSNV